MVRYAVLIDFASGWHAQCVCVIYNSKKGSEASRKHEAKSSRELWNWGCSKAQLLCGQEHVTVSRFPHFRLSCASKPTRRLRTICLLLLCSTLALAIEVSSWDTIWLRRQLAFMIYYLILVALIEP